MIEINGHTYTIWSDVEKKIFTQEEIAESERFAEAVRSHKSPESKSDAGSPKYSRDDKVRFKNVGSEHEGVIIVVNSHGIFGMNDQPYYGILTDNGEQMLFKNILESAIIDVPES